VIPRLETPPSRTVLVLVALAFALPGLTAHDPWKSFDAIGIEIAHQMHATGDWLLPRIGRDPWLEDPPLYHWFAAAFAKGFGSVLPLHGAIRLASGLFVLAALAFLYVAARNRVAPQQSHAAGAIAVLVLLGSIGLIVHAHEAVPDLAALAAICAAFVFWPHANGRPVRDGIGFGASLGAAFLASGPVAPAALALAALVAPLACRSMRAAAPAFLGTSALVAAVLSAAWPVAIAVRAPELAAAWWSSVLQPRGSLPGNLRYYLVTASWFAWPAWPLALWALWHRRKALLEPQAFAPLLAFAFLFAAIVLMGPTQDIHCIVLLPPLALLAPLGIDALRRGAANALDWFGVMTFSLFAALIWLGYVSMLTGEPQRIAKNFLRSAPGFTAEFQPLAVGFAIALLAAWIALIVWVPPSPTRAVLRWAGGVALLWGSFAALWLPWADYQKSYRGVALELKAKIPAGAKCIARTGLGNAQRAALSYHAAIHTRPFDRTNASVCPLLIVQGHPQHERDAPGAGWAKLADVGRPRDKDERFRMYQYRP
jgi:4-amino-4-deoxy-L-arabinose transferase-like glycosyltransferase